MFVFVAKVALTHLSLASHKRDTGKQYRPRLDAASDQGLHCLHLVQKLLQKMMIIKTNQTPQIYEMDLSKELR